MTAENEVVPYKNADFTCSSCQLIDELSFAEVCQLKDGKPVTCGKCAARLELPETERNRLLAQIERAGSVGKTMAIGGMLIFAATVVASIAFGVIASAICIAVCVLFFLVMNVRRKSIGFLQLQLVPANVPEPVPAE